MTVDHPEEEKCLAQDDLKKPFQEEQGGHSSLTFYFDYACFYSHFSPFLDIPRSGRDCFAVSESKRAPSQESKPTPSQERKMKSHQIKDVKTREEPFSPSRTFQFLLQFDFPFRISTIYKWAFVFSVLFHLLTMSNASHCIERNGTCYVLRDKGTSASCKEECIGVGCFKLTTDEQVSWVQNLQNCRDLHEMYFTGPNITHFPWGSHLNNLFHVRVTQTSIDKLDVNSQIYESITKIIVKDNPISDISGLLSAFPNLKEADFSNNNITKIPPINMEQNRTLSSVDLSNNKLVDLNFEYYSKKPDRFFNVTIKDSDVTIYHASGTKTVINITGNTETISCQDNKVEFDPSISVAGNVSCVNEDGSLGMIVYPLQKDAASGVSLAGEVALIILAVLVPVLF